MLDAEGDRPAGAGPCPACGTEVAPGLRVCPGCHRLVHAGRLKQLAAQAEEAERAGDLTAALTSWRGALDLLPPGTRQGEAIEARVADLGRRIDAPAVAPARPGEGGSWNTGAGAAGLGALALLAWKLKFVVVLALTKGKLLLLGLTKASTLLSMFASVGVYWTAFGWRLAAGLVASIYIHEMGHVAALRRYGVKADPPMFVPGLGAFVRLRQGLADPRQDARVGLAGPLWGLFAAAGSYAIFLGTGAPVWAAIARLGAQINLLNLIPIWQLDGGRAFRALTRAQRWQAAFVFALAWSLTSSSRPNEPNLLIVLAIVAAFQAWRGTPAREPDRGTLGLLVVLVAALSALTMIAVPV